MARLLPWLLWLVASLSFVLWSGSHTFHIGRMVLPRSQAIAIAICIVVVISLVLGWLWLVIWSTSRRLGFLRSPSLLDRVAVRWLLLATLPALFAMLAYGRWIEPRWVAVRELHLGEPAAGVEPVRIAVISDLHAESWRRPWAGLAEKVNALRPDLVLFLGDTLNHPNALPVVHRALGAMHAPHGKLAVRGNWDVWYWARLDLLGRTGFEWLRGERRLRIRGQDLRLVGMPYRDADGVREAERLLAEPGPGWQLFIYHTPDLIERVPPTTDLYLAGHTHGGQISIPFFGALVTLSRYGKRFERGLYQVGSTRLYVHPGIGVEPIIPLRLGVRPEVLLVVLGKKP
jgi:uncharacterized protein